MSSVLLFEQRISKYGSCDKEERLASLIWDKHDGYVLQSHIVADEETGLCMDESRTILGNIKIKRAINKYLEFLRFYINEYSRRDE